MFRKDKLTIFASTVLVFSGVLFFVLDDSDAFFCDEFDCYFEDSYEWAYEEGYEESYESSYESGYESGYQNNYQSGYESGYQSGYESGYYRYEYETPNLGCPSEPNRRDCYGTPTGHDCFIRNGREECEFCEFGNCRFQPCGDFGRRNDGTWDCGEPYDYEYQYENEYNYQYEYQTPNVAPSASNVTVTEPNYCVSGPAATTEWTYSDPEGDPQSAYQVQIDDQGSFSSPEWDSGKVSCSGCRSNATPQGHLAFNTTYKARTRVWDSKDAASDWAESKSWKTPIHAYPQTDFTFAGAIPGQQNLIPDSPIQFTDQSTCYNNPGNPIICDSWLWNFDDSGTSTLRNPQHTYGDTGTYNVNLMATDNDSNFCSITKPVQVIELNPIWIEVNPGG